MTKKKIEMAVNVDKEARIPEVEILRMENEKLRDSLRKHTEPVNACGRYQPETLISFESGHYKAFKGEWKGDSVWAHFTTNDGRTIHVNKDKVEYIQTK